MLKKDKRGNGNGHLLLNKVLDLISQISECKNIHTMAMSYLAYLFISYEFKPVSDTYIVDQHPHIDMILYKN